MDVSLNCSSLETSVSSLSKIFDCNERDIIKEISFNHKENFERQDDFCYFEDFLFDVFTKSFHGYLSLDSVIAFHGTRTLRNNNFENGLLNLSESLGQIWETLIKYSSEEHKNRFKELMKEEHFGYNDNRYGFKIIHQDFGPYGFLVKDSLFSSQALGNHDYLNVPEIIEDILFEYSKRYGFELLSLIEYFNKKMVSKIVSFKHDKHSENDNNLDYYIRFSIAYIYNKIRDINVDNSSLVCIDRKGKNIYQNDIVDVYILS